MKKLVCAIVTALTIAALPNAASARNISMMDLKIDGPSLTGSRVTVDAQAMSMGGMIVLTDPGVRFDTNGVMATIDGLSRESKMYLLQNCTTSCRITAHGVVENSLMGVQLRLLSVKPR
jgi:hypothetical protein